MGDIEIKPRALVILTKGPSLVKISFVLLGEGDISGVFLWCRGVLVTAAL